MRPTLGRCNSSLLWGRKGNLNELPNDFVYERCVLESASLFQDEKHGASDFDTKAQALESSILAEVVAKVGDMGGNVMRWGASASIGQILHTTIVCLRKHLDFFWPSDVRLAIDDVLLEGIMEAPVMVQYISKSNDLATHWALLFMMRGAKQAYLCDRKNLPCILETARRICSDHTDAPQLCAVPMANQADGWSSGHSSGLVLDDILQRHSYDLFDGEDAVAFMNDPANFAIGVDVFGETNFGKLFAMFGEKVSGSVLGGPMASTGATGSATAEVAGSATPGVAGSGATEAAGSSAIFRPMWKDVADPPIPKVPMPLLRQAQCVSDPPDTSRDAEYAALLAEEETMQAELRLVRAKLQEKQKRMQTQAQHSVADQLSPLERAQASFQRESACKKKRKPRRKR